MDIPTALTMTQSNCLNRQLGYENKDQPNRRLVFTIGAPVSPSNRYLRRRHKLLAGKALCVCQMYAVLHYFLRTESRKESNRAGNSEIAGHAAGYLAHEEWGGTPRGLREAQK